MDLSRDSLIPEQGRTLIKEYYLKQGETSPQEAFMRAAVAYSYGDVGLAQHIYKYASKQWFMFSSPVLSNAPVVGEEVEALPISCFLSYVPDNLEGLINHTTELRWLSVKGGGVGGHWSDVRSVSDKAPGPIPFIHTVDADMTAYKQGSTRKGSYAAYMDVSHPDIIEFINFRTPTGDINRKNLNIHHAVNIPDDFMVAVKHDLPWSLVDPKTKEIKDTMRARKLWELMLETRYRTGEPYLNFIDTANRALPEELKRLGKVIYGSNLCNEIHLPTSKDETAVCCLSSVNLEYYHEWKNTSMVRDLVRFLDNVIQFFIDHAPPCIDKAKRSAEASRPLGLGCMGLFSLFHNEMIDPESDEAFRLNDTIFSFIKNEAVAETMLLAKERGEPKDLIGSGKRNSHLLAIAPNANSSIILGTSPSIEPLRANAYTHRTRVGSHLIRNKYLEREIGYNTKLWKSIVTHGGSVQHLDIPDKLKKVYKTAPELSQEVLVRLAAQRQKYICQGQSLNLFFPAGVSRRDIHQPHFLAWELGCKGLYYLRTEAGSRVENVETKVERKLSECSSCQG